MQADALRFSQTLPDAPRCSEIHRHFLTCFQMLMDASRCSHMLVDASRCSHMPWMLPDSTRRSEVCPGGFQMRPDTSRGSHTQCSLSKQSCWFAPLCAGTKVGPYATMQAWKGIRVVARTHCPQCCRHFGMDPEIDVQKTKESWHGNPSDQVPR